jgi:hypothetical protein
MSRKDDVEQAIRESYEIIREYEDTIRTSSRPEESARARQMIHKQWGLIGAYLTEYIPLAQGALPADITEIAAHFQREQVAAVDDTVPPEPIQALKMELLALKENLDLVRERRSEYVLSTDIPLQLVKEERHLVERIRRLERRIDELRPIAIVRQATKLLTEPVARALTGEAWKALKQRLLTQASKLPASNHLDVNKMDAAAEDLYRLIGEVKTFLAAYRIDPDPGVLGVLERRAGMLADHLLAVYSLQPGEAVELELLVRPLQK